MSGLFLVLFGLAVYFMPWMVARSRGHKNAAAIAVLNFFLGWTALGWIIALIWAYTNDKAPANLVRPSMAPGA